MVDRVGQEMGEPLVVARLDDRSVDALVAPAQPPHRLHVADDRLSDRRVEAGDRGRQPLALAIGGTYRRQLSGVRLVPGPQLVEVDDILPSDQSNDRTGVRLDVHEALGPRSVAAPCAAAVRDRDNSSAMRCSTNRWPGRQIPSTIA